MKKLSFVFAFAMLALLTSCKQSTKQAVESAVQEAQQTALAVGIEDLLASADEYDGKEVVIKGMVTHVCKHGGQKCFVLAEDGETQIRINTSESIDEFDMALEGSTVEFTGIFKVLTNTETEELQEDHDAQEHHANEQAHTKAEKSSYFLEAISLAEITE